LATREYKTVLVKNSFGHVEPRYKVRLQVSVAGRTIRAWFTLANRANNNFPILIGRRTLRGRFLVDVGVGKADTPMRLLMLSGRTTAVVQKFVQGVERRAGARLKVTYTTYDDIQFSFSASGTYFTLRSTGEDIASFDIVHFKTIGKSADIPATVARYLQKHGVPVLDDAVAHFSGSSKLYQYAILSNEDIAIPASEFVLPSALPQSYELLVKRLGLPFVLKDIHASKGENNFLVRDRASFETACRQLQAGSRYAVAQQFIPNDGDYRVLVMGRRITLVIHRHRTKDDTHLNNTSKGATARLAATNDLPAKVQVASLLATEVLSRGVAGVDMVQDSHTKQWYCLEVNDGPQLASGAFAAEKQQAFSAYIVRETGLR